MSLPTSSSHCNLPPKLPFIDSNLHQSMLDSSLEANISHTGFGDSASPLMPTPSNLRSCNGYGSAKTCTNLLHAAASAATKPQAMPRSSSISRAYSATLSKLSSNSFKLGAASSKFSEKSAVTMSKALSSRNLRLRKRPGLPDFNPPHCERKMFDDGIVVQMIGSAIPPRLVPTIQLEDHPNSFLAIETHTPQIDVDFNLDESSFGFNRPSVENPLHIQVRSPSLELECPDIMPVFDGNLQTIYHSMDELTLAGDRPAVVAGSSTTSFLSPFESVPQADVFRSPSPRLSVSLMPKLSPIILSELSSLGEAEPNTSTQATSFRTQTPVTPALSPAFTSASGEPSPISTLNRLDNMDEGSVSHDTGADIYFNHDSENDVLNVLNLDLGEAPADSMSASESDLYGKDRRWDSLKPSSATTPVVDVQSSGQKPSFSSSSVLAPLTEADFEASFEEVFRTGFTGRHATQNDEQTTPKPKRLSVTKFNKSVIMNHEMNMATFPRRGHRTASSRTSLAPSLA